MLLTYQRILRQAEMTQKGEPGMRKTKKMLRPTVEN
jgi:hypothetical protein